MSKATKTPAASKTPAAKPAAAKPAAKAAAKPAAPKATGPKVHIIYDRAGKGDAENAVKALEKAGISVTSDKVSNLANYMGHEDHVYVPANLADSAAKALKALRTVRSQLVDLPTGDDDTIYAWIVR